MISFRPELVRRQTQVEKFLEEQFTEKTDYRVLMEAMRYSLCLLYTSDAADE